MIDHSSNSSLSCKKRKFDPIERIKPSKDPRLAHIRSKRIRQLESLMHYVYDLESEISRIKRERATLLPLPWEDVAGALKDDTLEQVRLNRSLKCQVEAYSHLTAVLQSWITSMNPETRIPSQYEETWQHSQLMAADPIVRKVGATWILQQVYNNTMRVMAKANFPSTLTSSMDIQVDNRMDTKSIPKRERARKKFAAPARIRPSKDPRLAHIRSKRARQMQSMRNYLYDLTDRLTILHNRHHQPSMLSWHDILKALQDDTLEQVRENRALKQQIDHAERLKTMLEDWVTRIIQPNQRVPSITEETWRHSQLLAGDEASRQIAFEWILRQVYHNTTRALAHVHYPDTATSCITIDISLLENEDKPILLVQGMTQDIMPYPLEEVINGYWVTEKTFAQAFRHQNTPITLQSCDIENANQEMQYLREEVPYPDGRIVHYNVLTGRFLEQDRMTIALRTILKDSAFPDMPENNMQWIVDTKQWIVADRINSNSTRCRTFYTIRHPFTPMGDVSLHDLASSYGVNAATDSEILVLLKRQLSIGHYEQRSFGGTVNCVLRNNIDMSTKRAPRRRKPESRYTYQLDALKREIYDMECIIQRLKRQRNSALSWEDIAKALQDDMLRLVKENRNLQHSRQAYTRFYHVLHACAQLHIDRAPTLAEETWRHGQLLSGDVSTRHLGYEWILKQVQYNTPRAMSYARFPNSLENYVDVQVTTTDNLINIHVTTQQVVAFSLQEVTSAYWIAEQSFARMYMGQTIEVEDELLLQQAQSVLENIQYVQEILDYGPFNVCYNVLSGQFTEETRTTLVLRTILQDEAHPTSPNSWIVDTKQWTVADQLCPNMTRCRTYYTIQHPIRSSDQCSLSLHDFALMFQLPTNDPTNLVSILKARSEANHLRQRTYFQTYFESVLTTLRRHLTKRVLALFTMTTKKQRMTIKLPIKPSKDPRFDHIKSRRAKSLEALRRYVFELEEQVAKLKRGKVALLPWEDIALALKDDMLEMVRDNRSLKRDVEYRKRMCRFLQECFFRPNPLGMAPSVAEETWQHSQLLAGDVSSRKTGCEWILQQLYHNTERAMAHIQFPENNQLDVIDINVACSNENLITVEVMSQEYLPYSLEHVAEAYGFAAASFSKAYMRKVAGYLDDTKTGLTDEAFHYESVQLQDHHTTIRYNTLSRFFQSGDRCILALRTILKDEAYPVAGTTWIMNTKQWVVIDKLEPKLTRCRTFYTIDHPFSEAGGYVPVADLTRNRGLPVGTDDTQNVRMLRDRYYEQHWLQRSFFQMHARCVADTIASKYDEDWDTIMDDPDQSSWLLIVCFYVGQEAIELPQLANIKSKRVKELEYLRRQVYILQGHIEKIRRCQSTLLSWEDVAHALKDDTLDQVRDNRSLKKKLHQNKCVGRFLKHWMYSTTPCRPPSITEEYWRYSLLVAGDEAARQIGYEWIARQAYHNTQAAMTHVSFDNNQTDYVQVQVNISGENHFFVQVLAQQFVDFDLDAVHDAFWIAEKSFAASFRKKSTDLKDLSLPNKDIVYLCENLGTSTQRIFNKTIQARFREADSSTFILRSILKDEMFPDDNIEDAWSFNTKFWMVANGMPDGRTRCRTFYTLDHPLTEKNGFVSLPELARCVGLVMPNESHLVNVVKERFLNSHHAQRLFFAQHLRNIKFKVSFVLTNQIEVYETRQVIEMSAQSRHLLPVVVLGCLAVAAFVYMKQRKTGSAKPPLIPRKPTNARVSSDLTDTQMVYTEPEGVKITRRGSVGPNDILVIGVCGGTGSGKTTLSRAIIDEIGEANVSYLSHDYYYRDISHKTLEQRAQHNFDHPDSLETSLLVRHLQHLRDGETVEVPVYDFTTHSRCSHTQTMVPRRVILVEGILLFTDPDLVALMDIKVFVETPSDIRFIRRLRRDIADRGRTAEGVIEQYLKTVRPMHLTFVEPSKRVADIIVPVGVNALSK
ncbi:uridine kinase [Thraustotheca clavata]|uniref:Uridine kinase n=1 Tax=Thraustotheca clavata TaxID=74557 RepID=A0A1V9ZXG6_9STRA|nr:uridine kinase [Thraustotheca clavata]